MNRYAWINKVLWERLRTSPYWKRSEGQAKHEIYWRWHAIVGVYSAAAQATAQ